MDAEIRNNLKQSSWKQIICCVTHSDSASSAQTTFCALLVFIKIHENQSKEWHSLSHMKTSEGH